MEDRTKRRSAAGWLAVAGLVLVAVGDAGGRTDGVPLAGLALPIGALILIVSFVLALRRRGDAAPSTQPSQDRGERRRSFYLRLLLLGLAVAPLSLAIAVVAGSFEAAAMFIPPTVFAVALAVAVWLSGRFFLGAMILGALLLLFAVASSELELRHPESFGNFVPALWMTVGFAVAASAAALALIQRRRGTLRPATAVQKLLVGLGVALLVAGSAVSWFVSGASRVTAAKAKGAPVVTMDDNEFIPKDFEAQPGEVARFYLVNGDSEPHTFTVDDLALDEYIAPRGQRLVSFEVPSWEAGEELELVCVVSGHEEMDGTIRVSSD